MHILIIEAILTTIYTVTGPIPVPIRGSDPETLLVSVRSLELHNRSFRIGRLGSGGSRSWLTQHRHQGPDPCFWVEDSTIIMVGNLPLIIHARMNWRSEYASS